MKPALRLSNYAIAPRYPDAFDDLTLTDATEAYKDAVTIKDFFKQFPLIKAKEKVLAFNKILL